MKKKKNNNYLYYILLAVLIILLFLPLGLKLFGKNLYVKKNIKTVTVTQLLCTKHNETITSTFLNGEPKNSNYEIYGNYVEEDVFDDDLIKYYRQFGNPNYDDEGKKTLFKVKVDDLKELDEYTALFSEVGKQKTYFLSKGFSCIINEY